jgi:DNA-binding Lrp family transcriptional regulator
VHLTKLQKRLCNELQGGLPICAKPFDDLAKYLGSDEETVLQEIRGLKEAGIIRRLRALTDYRALGFTGTLVAAHVPEQYLKAVAEAVNSLAQGNIILICGLRCRPNQKNKLAGRSRIWPNSSILIFIVCL